MSTATVRPMQLPPERQLRWNLILYFVILAIAPVVVVQVITLSLTTQDARAGVIRQLESVAEIKTNQLQRWIQEAHAAMDLILANSATYTEISTFLASGAADSALQSNVNQLLHNLLASQPGDTERTLNPFKDLFLYDRDGHVLAAS